MALVASGLMTLPVALFGNVAAGWVNTAASSPITNANPPSDAISPTGVGATGASPHDTQLSAAVLHEAANPAQLAQNVGVKADLPSGPLGIPGVVLDAYLKAQQLLAVQDPSCHLPWYLLAGIGRIESDQAENGEVTEAGETLRPILGPELNGSDGTAAIPAILNGEWTGDIVWQRAVGPMQFLPSTWLEYGQGGDPNNVYDAAAAAGRYLCASGLDLSQPANQAVAVFSYNHSDAYVSEVLIWADAYEAGVKPLPETPLPQGPQAPAVYAAENLPATSVTPNGSATTSAAAPSTSSSAPGSSLGGATTTTTTKTTAPATTTTTTTVPPTTTTTTSPTCTTTTTTSPTSTTTPAPTSTTTTDPSCPGDTTSTTTTTPTPSPTS